MSLESVTYVASGNIAPSRFVAMNGGAAYRVNQAAAADSVVGISGQGKETFDSSYHATDGRPCRVFGIGEVALLELGGTVTAGDYLAPDADGKGVRVTSFSSDALGARALRGGASGDLIHARVVEFQV